MTALEGRITMIRKTPCSCQLLSDAAAITLAVISISIDTDQTLTLVKEASPQRSRRVYAMPAKIMMMMDTKIRNH